MLKEQAVVFKKEVYNNHCFYQLIYDKLSCQPFTWQGV